MRSAVQAERIGDLGCLLLQGRDDAPERLVFARLHRRCPQGKPRVVSGSREPWLGLSSPLAWLDRSADWSVAARRDVFR